jgi:predicted permease
MITGERIVAQDVRLSLRLLRKSPGFTAVAVVTLALSIGANTVAFGVLNGLILNPLNVPRAQSLYAIQRGSDNSAAQSYPDYLDLRDRNRSFDSLAAYSIFQVGLDTGDIPTREWVYEVSGNYFDALGLQPHLGRFFHDSDERGPNSAPYIVISYAYWRKHFQGDPSVVGHIVRLNKNPFTVIGVAPPEFRGTLLFFSPAFYVPMVNMEQVEGENVLNAREKRWVFMVMGHLKAGVTPAQAIADLNSIGSYLEKTYPKETGAPTFSLARPGLGGDFLGGPVQAFVTALMLMAGLILLAACANLGNVFAARVADRSREIALRLALGSSRIRILRQLFTESVLISLIGGAAGLLGGAALLRQLNGWQPFPRTGVYLLVNPDANVYALALLLAIGSGLLFGAVPVRQILRTDPYEIIKSGSIGKVGRRIAIRDLLLVAQIAICTVLVTSSIVAVRGLVRSMHANFGIEPQNAMLIETNLRMAGYTGDTAPAMRKRMIEAAQTIPGVESVGLVNIPPLTRFTVSMIVFTDKTTDLRPANAAAEPFLYNISPEYFQAAGTALLAGRALSWHDDSDSPPVAVVNREFAKKIFGSVTNAEGGYFLRRDGTRVQVVGIVEDGKYQNLAEDQTPAVFLPILQSSPSMTRIWMVARSNGDPQRLAASIQSKMYELDSGLPFYIATWQKEVDGVLFPSRMAAWSLGVLGLMGAVLSISGIFGMAIHTISKRQRELGIRIAVGAGRKEILQAALGRAFKVLALGSVAGLALGILAGRVLALIVYHATPREPLVLGGVALVMLSLGLLATWIPARRALSVDPLRLLRTE